jgi:hypothetical protein
MSPAAETALWIAAGLVFVVWLWWAAKKMDQRPEAQKELDQTM